MTYGILLIGLVPWQMVLVIALLQFLAEMFIARQYSLAQIFVTPLALMSTELAGSHSPGTLIQDRALETLIGSAVGIAVVMGMHYVERTQTSRERHGDSQNLNGNVAGLGATTNY